MNSLHIQTLGHGKPVVLLHGWAMHSGLWGDFALRLAKQFRVILVDLPGHGGSGKLQPFTLDTVTTALASALPEEPACWVGWSLGAQVALTVAARFPRRVSGLGLIAGNPCFLQQNGWPGMKLPVLEKFAGQLVSNTEGTLQRFLAIQVLSLPNAKTLAKQLQTQLLIWSPPDAETLQGGLHILKTADLRPTLAATEVPVFVVLGDKDSLVPVAVGNAMQNLQPNAQIHVLPGSAHIPFLTHPDQCIALVGAFMERLAVE